MMFGMTKFTFIHLADHREIEENGGAFALCGDWVTTPDEKGTQANCRRCLRQERKKQREDARDDEDVYYEDDESGTDMMKW